MENAVVKYIGNKFDQLRDEIEDHKTISIVTGAVVVGVVAFLVVRKIMKSKKKIFINTIADYHDQENKQYERPTSNPTLEEWEKNIGAGAKDVILHDGQD
jgi:GMP synthase PP-ATPase subunit